MSRRSRSRSRSGSFVSVALLVLLALVLVAGSQGTGAFANGSLERASGVEVTNDTTGAYGIDTAAAVHTNTTGPLVTLTNQFDQDVTVTVTLRSDSTDTGDLVLDGTNHGDEVSFALARGESRTVDIAVRNDSSLVGDNVYFHARASATGLYASAEDRAVPIES